MKKHRPNLRILKLNIQTLFVLLVMLLISFLYQALITALLLVMWPALLFIGSWLLSNEKFEKWVGIYHDNIPDTSDK